MNEQRRSQLRAEIRQQRPFVSLSQEAAVAVLRTADVVHRRIAATLEPHGITPQQYNVLRILRGAGENGLPTLEIAVRMIERAPGITGLLDRLEAKEMIRRDRKAGDRRCVVCRITPAGRELLARLDGPIEKADRALFDGMPDAELKRLLEGLAAIRLRASGEGSDAEASPETQRTGRANGAAPVTSKPLHEPERALNTKEKS